MVAAFWRYGGAAALASLIGACAPESGLIVFSLGSDIADEQFEASFKQAGSPWTPIEVHGEFAERPYYDERLIVGHDVTVRVQYEGATARLHFAALDDVRHEIHIAIVEQDPTWGCMGCGASASADIEGRGNGKKLWVYESFNGISGPIIF